MAMNIRRKTTLGPVVRVRYVVSCNWFFTRYHANPGHLLASQSY